MMPRNNPMCTVMQENSGIIKAMVPGNHKTAERIKVVRLLLLSAMKERKSIRHRMEPPGNLLRGSGNPPRASHMYLLRIITIAMILPGKVMLMLLVKYMK